LIRSTPNPEHARCKCRRTFVYRPCDGSFGSRHRSQICFRRKHRPQPLIQSNQFTRTRRNRIECQSRLQLRLPVPLLNVRRSSSQTRHHKRYSPVARNLLPFQRCRQTFRPGACQQARMPARKWSCVFRPLGRLYIRMVESRAYRARKKML
jgi:hypothetical protein